MQILDNFLVYLISIRLSIKISYVIKKNRIIRVLTNNFNEPLIEEYVCSVSKKDTLVKKCFFSFISVATISMARSSLLFFFPWQTVL